MLRPARGSEEAACPAQLCGPCGVLALETSLCRALMAPGRLHWRPRGHAFS